ncbi:DNA primase [Thraustotheca clavata]|uniref:DNA primase large subunit n=1 Tax=Thraustotheca clavata TaxID=74557 RepID=A0A1W0AAK1_9STRA|nr:DNA primase [Thraustotheca clavata]
MLNVGNTSGVQVRKQQQNARVTLSMYQEPPNVEVTLEEFESYSIDRLQMLKTLELVRLRGRDDAKVEKAMAKFLPLRTAEDREKDEISHFILRMAFCHSEELRRWFLTQESSLFKHRLDQASRDEKMNFMKKNRLVYDQVDTEEFAELKQQLTAVHLANKTSVKEALNMPDVYVKVPFTEAIDLIGQRKVFLKCGVAYVPFDHLVTILFARFRSTLSKQLAIAFRKFNGSAAARDDRLLPVLKNLAKHHIGPDYGTVPQASGNAITPEMIDGLAATAMPLCMKTLHNAMKTQSHLKHGGRMQYGLFLKGIGLQMDDAITFWRNVFCKKMNVDEFNKKYAYNIRHNYGKEGKRKDYTPFNCVKIITGDPPKAGEYHGCPFRHFDEHHLRASLRGINEIDKESIITLARNKDYQLACRRHFEALFPKGNIDAVGNHPNAFFEEARKAIGVKPDPVKQEPVKQEQVKQEPVKTEVKTES